MGQKIRSSARSLHAVYVYGQSVGNSVATGVDLSKYWGNKILGERSVAEKWRRVWGDGKHFRGPRFLNDIFSEKIPIFTAKISDDLFLVINMTRFFGFSLSFPRFSVSFTTLTTIKTMQACRCRLNCRRKLLC